LDTTGSWTADGPRLSLRPLAGAPAAVGEMVGGRWLVSQIRRGGQAWVLVADDVERGIRRAIKVPLRDGVIADDAELAMLLGIEPHPSVVSALDVADVAGRRGIVLEYVPSTLGELLRQRGTAQHAPDQPPLPDAVALALQQACAGLAHLSAVTEVAHLDLKPSNMLIDDDGHAKIADFGLAQQVRIQNGRFPVARGGTWAYAAPEVLRQEPCDTRADIFSFGVLLYEACTGRLPYPFRLENDPSAQRRQLLDYYASSGPRDRTEELYYWDQVKRRQLPVTVPYANINILLSGLLMNHMEERHRSFEELSPLLATALRRPPLRAEPATLREGDQQRRELALCWTLIRLGRFGDAVTRLNRLLASPLPEALSPAVFQAAKEALTRAGRHAEAAALRDWGLPDEVA
jgi:serine/threonine protein kinase